MLRVVIDNSSLVSYILTQGEIMSRIVARWRAADFVLLSSPDTMAELSAVLSRPRIKRRSRVPLVAFVQGMTRFSYHVPGDLNLTGACRDPKDDKFIACAVEGRADYLVSSDKDLLVMHYYEQVAIVNPGQFLVGLELYRLESTELAARFSREVMLEIRANIPLDQASAEKLNRQLLEK